MIHLIYGLSGTGKTDILYQEIQKDIINGQRSYVIVPEQHTVEVERTMAALLPPSAQLTFEVLNFTRLADKMFRLCGGLSYHYITRGMKNLYIWRTIRLLSPFFKEYGSTSATDRSLPEVMLAAISELKAADISPSALESAADRLPEDSSLRRKLLDLSLIAGTYETMVAESYDDASDDLGKLAQLLESHPFFQNAHVYIDGFVDFTAMEYKIIHCIFAQAAHVSVTLLCDRPDSDAAHLMGAMHTSDKLRHFAGNNAKITRLTEIHRTSSEALTRLNHSLWDFADKGEEPPRDSKEAVTLYACRDAYEEAAAVIATVSSLVRKGYRYREIAVVARNAESYRGILDVAFEKAGIPFFLSEKTDIGAKPLIAMIFAAFAIKNRGFRRADMISYIRTGYSGISDYEADIFEDYITKWNIGGKDFAEAVWRRNPDGYEKSLSKRAETILSVANDTKNKILSHLMPFFDALDRSKTAADFCEALYDFLCSLKVAEQLKEEAAAAIAAGDKKEAAETAAIFRTLIKTLQDMHAAMKDETVTAEEFVATLRLMLDGTEIGTIPTAPDEVMVGSASMLRTTRIRHAILVGLCEGEFPAKVSEKGVFSDADRLALETIGLPLSGSVSDKAAEELLYVYRAMTMPSEGLTLCYHAIGAKGEQNYPSLAYRRVCTLLSAKEIAFGSLPLSHRIFDKEHALEALSGHEDTSIGQSLKTALEEDPDYHARLMRGTRPVSSPKCTLDAETITQLFGKELNLTQSRLESYVSCHFHYYCRYILGLRENGRADFTYANIGTFIHRVLEIFMKESGRQKIDPDRDSDLIREIVGREIKDFAGEVFSADEAETGRIAHLLMRLYRLSSLIATDLCRETADSRFLSRFFELPIGKDSPYGIEPPTVTLKDGSTVRLHGVVDRVDTYFEDGKLYIRVVDYKTGKKKFSLDDVKEGFSLQLLLYLFAICDSQSGTLKKALDVPPETDIHPAGAVYLSTALSPVETTPHEPVESVLAKASGKISRSGLILNDGQILTAMSQSANPSILAGITQDTSGGYKGAALTSADDFNDLRSELYSVVDSIATEMFSGNASATPLEHGGSLPCMYCQMKQFCRTAKACAASKNEDIESNDPSKEES